ncbi:MAG: hypothetical protein BIFFINMI_01533 [Phycisphaerae bacterium]|nr:hypothetical protein [Phycisphaerae bacterium]
MRNRTSGHIQMPGLWTVPPLAQAPRAATVGPAARADDDPHWQSARSDAVRLLQSRSLSADQQRAVRQYFDLGQ